LIALAVVIGSFGKQDTSPIPTLTIRGPDAVNVIEELIVFWLCGSVDEDVPTVFSLAGLSLGQGHMTVLLKAKGDVCTSRGLQGRA
jgi:hypothetical protein